jgi:hypothetical protein
MTVDWNHVLLEQFDLEWNLAHGPSLETLTDDEYLWEPVPGCWSIRPTGPDGRGEFDQAWPDPEPSPVTTIAWRLSHLAVGVFGLRASHHFGDGSLTHENAERPLTAKEGVAYFKEQALQWRSHIERLDEEGLARLVGEPEAQLNAPWASLVLHVNREALHHLAEVSLLRDLYRATGGARVELEDRAARRHLDGCHAPAEQHDEPVTVMSANQAGVLGQGRNDMLGDLVRIGRARLVVPDVQVISADEPDAQHDFSHGHAS